MTTNMNDLNFEAKVAKAFSLGMKEMERTAVQSVLDTGVTGQVVMTIIANSLDDTIKLDSEVHFVDNELPEFLNDLGKQYGRTITVNNRGQYPLAVFITSEVTTRDQDNNQTDKFIVAGMSIGQKSKVKMFDIIKTDDDQVVDLVANNPSGYRVSSDINILNQFYAGVAKGMDNV